MKNNYELVYKAPFEMTHYKIYNKMKKIFSLVMFFAALSFWGCNADKQDLPLQVEEQMVTVRASIDTQPESRVSHTQNADGSIKTHWEEGDAFLGVTGSSVIKYTDAVVYGSNASFTSHEFVANGNKVNALYPLNDSYLANAASADGFEISLAGQDGTLAKLADYTYMTASATADKGMLDFKFKHEIVILRLTGMMFPEGTNASRVSEIIVNGTGINDAAVVKLTGDAPVVSVSAADCSVSVKGNFAVTNRVMDDVYVAFFPTPEMSDFTISAITADNNRYNFKYTASVEFQAGKLYTLRGRTMTGIVRVSQYETYPNESVYYAIDYTDIKAIDEFDYESGYFKGKTIVMLNDIDMSAAEPFTNTYVGTSGFKGTFDGMGYAVKNLGYGLFNSFDGATIKNLTLEGHIDLESNVITLGYGFNGTKVINVHNNCKIDATVAVNGITRGNVIVFACTNSADLYSSSNQVNGIGTGSASVIVGCYNEGKLTGNSVNGIGDISDVYGCYNIGELVATYKSGIGSSSDVYNSLWLTSQASECCSSINVSENNVGCSSVEEVNNNVSVLNAGIKKWNDANPTNTCDYHYVKGTDGKGPQLVYGAPQ